MNYSNEPILENESDFPPLSKTTELPTTTLKFTFTALLEITRIV